MEIRADTSFLLTVLLVSIRVGAVLVLTPLFAVGEVPVRVRVLLAFGLAVVLTSVVPMPAVAAPLGLGGLAQAAALELATGGLLAFGVMAPLAALSFGGRILDFQLGFGVAGLVDPATRTQAPLIGTLLQMLGVTTFFLLNGHHLLVRGLAATLRRLPPGAALPALDGERLVAQFGLVFAFGVVAVAPALVTLLLLDVGMAVAARTMPQVNMFILGIPIKVMVGLSVLAVSMHYAGPLLERIYTSMFGYWDAVAR